MVENDVDAYALEVVAGRVPAGKYHRLACQRHLKDRTREGTEGFPWRFELDRATRFFRFAEQLKHYKGEWAGQPIVLQPYQRFRLGSVFAWVHRETGLRRFRTSYHEIPRKNGKSLEAAVVMLYLSFFDGEAGAEGYCIATKRDQAKLVFRDCQQLVKSSGLKNKIDVHVGNLHRDDTASKLEPLGADHDSTDGLNPNAVCADELHAYRDRGLLDVMETATGARRQAHFLKITTAGDDPVSPGGDEHDYACKILDGVMQDETYFAFIAHADADDAWDDERTWAKANPNWLVSIKPDDMRSLATKARGIPAAAATFKQKRLNLWVNATAPCLSIDGWRKGQTTWSAKDMLHEPCFVGIDLASKLDLMACVFVFPPTVGRGTWRILPYVWTPEETLKDRAHRDRAPYDIWVDQGWLLTTPGPVLDYSVVREKINAHRADFDIERIAFDPWHADQLANQLLALDGWSDQQVIAVPQTFQGLSSAEAKFQAEVMGGNVDAGGSPLLAWCASNVVSQTDGKENIMFTKKKSRGRIDPIKAATTAMSLALRMPIEQSGVSFEWV